MEEQYEVRLTTSSTIGIIAFGITGQDDQGQYFIPIMNLQYIYPEDMLNNQNIISYNIPKAINEYYNPNNWDIQFIDHFNLGTQFPNQDPETVKRNILGSLQIHIVDLNKNPDRSVPVELDFAHTWKTGYLDMSTLQNISQETLSLLADEVLEYSDDEADNSLMEVD